MNLLLEPKYINEAWKVTFWLYVIDGIVRLPLRFFRSYFSLETLDIFFIIRFLFFLLAIFLVGILYVKSTRKVVDKPLKRRVSIYVSLISLVAWLFFTGILGEFFVNMFGGLVEGILSVIITFLAVYFILPLGNRFITKKKIEL